MPAGACFADFGNNVICVDKIKEKIEVLNKGEIPLYEPGLKEIVEKNLNSGNLKFTTDLKNSVKNADVIMLAVGTPTNPKNGHADLTYIKKAVEEIAEALSIDDGYKVIATKSTVPIGTNEMLAKLINKTNPNIEFDTVSIPEFLREGKAVPDFINPDQLGFAITLAHIHSQEKLYLFYIVSTFLVEDELYRSQILLEVLLFSVVNPSFSP